LHFLQGSVSMIERILQKRLLELSKQFPAIALMGPRQSGKTTLAKVTFPHYFYVSLEDLDMQAFAKNDTRGFLEAYDKKEGLIIDEAQRVPELFSYLQGFIDRSQRPGFYILTGSQHFLLYEKITQSLAGRIALLSLLPLSVKELTDAGLLENNVESIMLKGFYPRLYNQNIEIDTWCSNYVATYLERDVRNTLHVSDILSFQKFIKLCAARVGNIINFADLARDCDISPHTAKAWLSILQMSYIVDLVYPYYRNFNKRVIKSPKLYFYDTGLLCFLLGIKTVDELIMHPLKGTIFESFVYAELCKGFYNHVKRPPIYFWRDTSGYEVDFVLERVYGTTIAIEVKAKKTFSDDFFQGNTKWATLSEQGDQKFSVIYAGDQTVSLSKGNLVSWSSIDTFLVDQFEIS
jgi:uncharacterized protein